MSKDLASSFEELAKAGKPLFPALCKKFKLAESTIRRKLSALRKQGEIFDYDDYLDPAQKVEEGTNAAGEYYIVAKGPSIRTLNELLKVGDDDLDRFMVSKYRRNCWEGHAKSPDGKLVRYTNWQVRAEFGLKSFADTARQLWESLKRDLLKTIKAPAVKKPKILGNSLFELGIFDFHLGNDDPNWGIDCAIPVFKQAVIDLASKAKMFKPGRILFPIGNDFFHVDSKDSKTTNGTQLTITGTWQAMFDAGVKLQIWAIELLRQIAPVDVVVVPGNHDEMLSKCLGEVLIAYYRRESDVLVDNREALRKYYKFGQTLLGLTHGKYEPYDTLPLLMATESPKDWSQTQFHEFHVGHVHHRAGKGYATQYLDTGGVLVRVLPSLAEADEWHRRKGFTTSTKAAEAYIFDPDEGLIATLHTQRSKRYA